jgi:pimeloyl-ACP methyl ester carboxylesterase
VKANDFEIVERGSGPPLVLIPGIQGRWEYSTATVDALSRDFRVVTFSLCDERPGRAPAGTGVSAISEASPDRTAMDVFADQVQRAMDRSALDRAVIVGVSFGGLVALRFAATRPSRVSALVMVSAPGPHWRLRARHERYTRLPWMFGPLFAIESPWRLRHEMVAALPDRSERLAVTCRQLGIAIRAPISLARMAARARCISAYDRTADAARVDVPTLVVQGEPALDHVTGTGGTSEYARLIAGARLVTIARTGHLGSITRADECARTIMSFVKTAAKGSQDSAA